MTALAGLAVVGVLAVSVPAVSGGSLSGVLLGMLALLALASFEAVRPLPAAAAHLAGTAQAARRVLDLTDRTPPVTDPGAAAAAAALGDVRCAACAPATGTGRGCSTASTSSCAPAAIVALTGPSGAGKTTLANLLVRFRDPDGGAVELDGHDLRRYAQADVRRVVGLAGQEAHLFPTSIRENLRIARPGATDAELGDALRRAHSDGWVAGLPDGLDTRLGEGGTGVSGGQRQRLALARALLADVRCSCWTSPPPTSTPRRRRRSPTSSCRPPAPRAWGCCSSPIAGRGSTWPTRCVELRDGRIAAAPGAAGQPLTALHRDRDRERRALARVRDGPRHRHRQEELARSSCWRS